jgi:exodeoxyribonuclease-3
MKIATWNINGVKARTIPPSRGSKEAKPDIACLQEIKSVDDGFPAAVFEALGYRVETHGQKGFNGVALLSRHPLEDVSARPARRNDEDTQARYIEARVQSPSGSVRVGCLYLPNGNPLGTEKFDLQAEVDGAAAPPCAEDCLAREETPFLLLGDYNVIPEPRRREKPGRLARRCALFQPESRQRVPCA